MSGIPLSLKNIEEEIDASLDPGLENDRHCLPSQGHFLNVTLKLSRHKDPQKRIFNKKTEIDPESVNLPATIKVHIT